MRLLSRVILAGSWLSLLPAQTPVFRATTELQSIAVQAVDGKGNFVPGLTAADFTLLEDGRPQKIAFFGAEQQPASIAILLDSSRSMDYGRKFDRARELLAPLIAGHHPDDEIVFMPFTERVQAYELTPEQRLHPAAIILSRAEKQGGTALYDALASALCHLRAARNLRQAVVAITDGADQHSRLNLEQVVELARMSTAQIFMVGFFSRAESAVYREKRKTITLLGEHEIDNPLLVFERLSKESGAESFFPSSESDLKTALDRISEMLQAQYTLAYYPQNADRFRKIEVRVHRGGVKVMARRGVGSAAGGGPVHFQASTCEVSPEDHPFPWEPKSVRTVSGGLVYHEDFSDPKSGWPNRREQIPDTRRTLRQAPEGGGGEYRPGLRYVPGGYEISHHPPARLNNSGPIADGVVAAYGPSWDNERASVSVHSDWARTLRPQGNVLSVSSIAAGLVFHLNEEGYYALLLSGGTAKGETGRSEKIVQFKLVRKLFGEDAPGEATALIPWTAAAPSAAEDAHKISVEYKDGQIKVMVDDHQAAGIRDNRLPSGLTGLAVFGDGDAVFHDLTVQDLN